MWRKLARCCEVSRNASTTRLGEQRACVCGEEVVWTCGRRKLARSCSLRERNTDTRSGGRPVCVCGEANVDVWEEAGA
jgi:hypothetical protein